VAVFRLALFGTAPEELRWTRDGEVPRWVLRVYQSYGRDADDAPLSASVEALSEGLAGRLKALALALRKMEDRGWEVSLDGRVLLVASALPRDATVEALQEDGVWTVVRELAVRDESGGIAWA
jgi:hypothetical protein